jgi:Response regulator containing CheY-like receiver, AAA-type ATPase, and DNA-binding domains
MGLVVDRKDVAGTTTLVLEFPKTAGEEMAGLSATEIDDAGAQSTNSKALAGSHVLVVASRREVRVLIRDALRNMSMLVDFVASIEEAASFCREGLPHAIIIDSILKGSRFANFRDEILGEVPTSSSSRSSSRARPSRCREPTARRWHGSAATSSPARCRRR